MKPFLILVALFLSFSSYAQLQEVRANKITADQVLRIPVRDTNYTPSRIGELVIRPGDLNIYKSISTSAPKKWDALGSGSSGSGWGLTGNSGTNPSDNFLGTTDNQPFQLKINNIRAMRITPFGAVSHDSLSANSVYIGQYAGFLDTGTVSANVGIGAYALYKYPKDGPNSATACNIAIGHQALFNFDGSGTSEGNVAIGSRASARTTSGYRNVAIGVQAGHNTTTSDRNTGVGSFANEWNSTGRMNDAYGEGALRINTTGQYNTGIGANTLWRMSGGIREITITNGGSGYTSATVTITGKDVNPFGFNPSITATATATVNAGAVTAITIVEPGIGYTNPIITINGDGTGATATATVFVPEHNVALGNSAMAHHRYGSYNTSIGANSGGGFNGEVNTYGIYDSMNTYLGNYASRYLADPTVVMKKSTAIGYNAKVGRSQSLVLGATGSDQPNVGIGTIAPTSMLNIRKDDLLTTADSTQGIFLANETDATALAPAQNSPGIWFKSKGWASTSSTSREIMWGMYAHTVQGTTNPSGRFHLVWKLHGISDTVMRVQNNGSLFLYTTSTAGGSSVQLMNTDQTREGYFGYQSSNGRLQVRADKVGSYITLECDGGVTQAYVNSTGIEMEGGKGITVGTPGRDASALLEVKSTTKGFLPPRMTATEASAIASPAEGLMVYVTNTNGTFTSKGWWGYNGAAWEKLNN